MLWLQLAWVLLKELVRALVSPLRLLCYLPRRHYWRAQARDVLAHLGEPDPHADLERFFARHRPARGEVPHLFIGAGEASGEGHAVRLVHELRDRTLRWSSFGGQPLAQAGTALLFPLSEHAVMGLVSVLKQLPLILRAYVRFLRLLRDDPPDLVILVDYPGLHLVMAKAAHRRGIPVLHYIAPQYWAWGPWRMRRYRRSVDATLTILPFEPPFFARFGVPSRYVGHPLLDQMAAAPPDPAAVAAFATRRTLTLLPGSRRAEIQHNLPGMLQVAERLRALEPDLRVCIAHRDGRRIALIRELVARHGATWAEVHHGELGPALAGARLILAKSGTGSLEACLHLVPTIVVYQLASFWATWGYHNVLSVPHIAGANLIAGRTVVPEFCFHHQGGWQDVGDAAERLWRDDPARAECLRGLDEVRQRLGAPGASARAAAVVRQFLDHRT